MYRIAVWPPPTFLLRVVGRAGKLHRVQYVAKNGVFNLFSLFTHAMGATFVLYLVFIEVFVVSSQVSTCSFFVFRSFSHISRRDLGAFFSFDVSC